MENMDTKIIEFMCDACTKEDCGEPTKDCVGVMKTECGRIYQYHCKNLGNCPRREGLTDWTER